MKKIISLIMLLAATMQLSAQTMKDIITNMPDSITPLLTKNNRLNLIDYIEAGEKAVEKNRLGGETQMTHLSQTRCVIEMTSSSTVDFKLLSSPEPSIGVITTMHNSENTVLTSYIQYFTLDWKLIKDEMPKAFVTYSWKEDSEELESRDYTPLKLDNTKFEK